MLVTSYFNPIIYTSLNADIFATCKDNLLFVKIISSNFQCSPKFDLFISVNNSLLTFITIRSTLSDLGTNVYVCRFYHEVNLF